MKKQNKLLGGILLVAGTTIGAGMLALPISTGMAGIFPSLLVFIAYWIYMTFTAFLMLEVNLWMESGNNLNSMAKYTLGKIGQVASWTLYLFLLYSLLTAYIAGGGPIVLDAIKSTAGIILPAWAGWLPLLVVFGFFVYKGTRSVDYANRLLMIGLVITYCLMVIFLTPHLDQNLLDYANWKYVLMGISVVATSFGFHIIIPSLVTYLDRDISMLKKVIMIGSLIPLLVYISWEFLVLGIVPILGENGIQEGYVMGSNGAHLMTAFLENPAIAMIATFFSFFAIITSFLGVALSLFDFLADGFSIEKNRPGRVLLYVLTFLPPLLISLIDPRAFLSALEYAGAFGVVTLLGLLPALMVWSGRYVKKLAPQDAFRTPGGKVALLAAMMISLAIISLEVMNKL
jgi:tyrosine-specific transport protein